MTVQPIYPTAKVYIDFDRDGIPETDISSRIVSDIKGKNGTPNAKESDRIGNAGKLTFEIENQDHAYTGLEFAGCAVSVHLTYEGRSKQVFFGQIDHDVELDSGPHLPLHVGVTVNDWMNTANNTQLANVEVETFKTASEGMNILMDALSDPPAERNFDDGTEIFPNVLDGSGKKAKTYSELDKFAKSELGAMYLTFRSREYGEVLRFENKYARNANVPLSRIPTDVLNPPLLKYHGNSGSSGLLKYHGNSGASGHLKIHKAQSATLGYMQEKADWHVGRNLLNKFTVTNVFRLTDVVDVLLYKLTYPVPLGTTEELVISGVFTDQNGGTVIRAIDTFPDNWTVNSLQNGTGTDLTSSVQVSYFGWSNNFEVRFRNEGAPGFVTNVEVWGKGIKKYNPNVTEINNEESQDELNLIVSDSLTREYSSDITSSRLFARRAIALQHARRRELLSVSYKGNISELLLMAFMYLDQGSKVNIDEIFPVYSGIYYIQGIEFNLKLNKTVEFTWHLKEEVESMLTPIGVITNTLTGATENAIDFDIVPHLNNLPEYSYSFWIKASDFTNAVGYIIGNTVDEGTGRRGNHVFLDDGKIFFSSYRTPTDGRWSTSAVITSNNTYYHICITYKATSDVSKPVIYVGGTAVALTEISTPSGSSDDYSDAPFILFNASRNPLDLLETYDAISYGYGMKDVRKYNRILSPDEVATLAAGEDDYSTVPDGLIFKGIYVPTDNVAAYTAGETITEGDLILDAIHGIAGTPFNEDITSNTLMLRGETI